MEITSRTLQRPILEFTPFRCMRCRVTSIGQMLIVAQDRTIERLWHMFVPPIMTYLDDYQAAYKLKGVDLVLHLLKNTPAHLLRRTGMDVLLATVSKSLHR